MAWGKWIVLIAAVVALVVTKPDAAAFRAYVTTRLQQEIVDQKIAPSDDFAQMVQAACAIAADQCAQVLQGFLKFHTEDDVLATHGMVRYGDRQMSCWGLLRSWWCLAPEKA